MADDVTVPALGKAPKKVLIPVAVGAAAFIAWKYWQARNGTGADAGSSVTDGEFGAVDSAIPGVLGAVSPTNSYGDGGNPNDNGDSGVGPGHFTNNGQWTDYVVGKLSQSDKWSYTDIVTAIGNGLAGRPTTTEQQDIIRAAIAVGGQPPEGAIIIVPGGNTGITIAPTNAHLQSVSTSAAVIAFNSVPGAVRYTVYASGGGVGIGTTSPVTISGLKPNTTYTMNVAATSAAGTDGPRSNNVTVKTQATSLKAPGTPSLVKATGDALVVKTTAVSGATGYRWLISGKTAAISQGVQATLAPLHRKTRYSVSVRAMIAGQPDGPASASRTFSTK
jgi:hypothetical protein